MDFSLEKADMGLFAVYHTLYTPDIEMWFDYKRRLRDTNWSNDCYFVLRDGNKVGGALIGKSCISHAFMIPPFHDRVSFWQFLIANAPTTEIHGALESDARVLKMLGFKTTKIGQVMCRPADLIDYKLDECFCYHSLDLDDHINEVAAVISKSYKGGICDEINGVATLEEIIADCKDVRNTYDACYRLNAVIEKRSGRITALCVAGHGQNYVNAYNEIADVCVLPEFRGRGLAQYLVARAVSEASGHEPYVKLFVYIGNNAEYIYNKLGFVGGPQFSNMSQSVAQAEE